MKRRLCVLLCALAPVCAVAAVLAAAAPAALNAYLKADGLQGESHNTRYVDAMDVLAWSWGVANPEGKKPSFSDISVTKYVDRASPKLMEYAAGGTVIPRMKLSIVRAGEAQQEFLRYCFAGVRVTSVSSGGSLGEDRLTENVSFSYDYIVERYARQRDDGSLDTPVFGGWDLIKNLVLPPGDC